MASIDTQIRNAERTYRSEQTERNSVRLIQLYLRAGRTAEVERFERPDGVVTPTREFGATTRSGECGLCNARFERGDRAFYLGTLRRPNGERSYQQLGRGETSVRFRPEYCTCKGYKFHTRACALRGRMFWRYETLPGVWERMVHVACASEEGYTVPGATVDAERGRRTLGRGDSGA